MNEPLGIDMSEDVNESQILKYFPDAFINIEPDNITGLVSTKMIYHWRKLFKMVTMSETTYETVILLRPDIYLKDVDISSIINNIPNKDILYGLSEISHIPPPEHIYVNDCLFIGEFKLMRETFLSFYEPDISRKCIHYHLARHFTTNDIYVERVIPDTDSFFVMRSLHRNYLHCDYSTKMRISETYEKIKHHHYEDEHEKRKLLIELSKIKKDE